MFDEVLEEWACKYKPMSHIPGETSVNKRFFLVDSILNIPQIVTGMNATKSPCLAYEFHQEGNFSGDQFFPTYVVSVMVKADTNKTAVKERSNEAVKEAMMHGKKLLAWLNMKLEQGDKRCINLDLGNVPYDTLGPMYNNWYAVFFTIRDVGCSRMQVDPNDYNE